jgi:hypothetical protein
MTNSSSSQSGPSGSYAIADLPPRTMDQGHHQADLTAEALERLQISNGAHTNSNEATTSARSAVRDGILRRQPSQTPSVTSVSTGPEGDSREPSRPSSRQTARYMKDQYSDKGKGKGKAVEPSGTTISDFPGEVLIAVSLLTYRRIFG